MVKSKIKKLTDKEKIKNLKESIKTLETRIAHQVSHTNWWEVNSKSLQAEIQRLKEKQDDRFINERAKLIDSISGMTEAVSKAIIYAVGKETL